MRIGQTSVVVFGSKFVGSALGFVATIYFARELGAEVLGYYALVIALVAWLKLGGHLGISSAMTKRMSEGEDSAAFASASVVLVAILGLFLSVLVLVFRPYINDYVGASVANLVAVLLLVGLFQALTNAALQGEHKVHIAGLLTPLGIGARSVIQIALVSIGLGLVGMLVGAAVGSVIVGSIGLLILSTRLTRPRKSHFDELIDYAKFSWLGGLKNRSFNDVDILLLGIFVQSSFIGVYSAAWSISKFLTLFDSAISSTLFPELSRANAEDSEETVSTLIEDSLTYGGLLLIPGLFGGWLLADRLLKIYGPEFVQGTTVLWVLILATLVYAYQKQLMNAMNGIDRPDAAFRINLVFIASNVVLNLVLISTLGFVGAAIATAISAAIGLGLSMYVLRSMVSFAIPIGELTRQISAAVIMAGSVWMLEGLIEMIGVTHNFAILVSLVIIGAGTYFGTLFSISKSFRTTVLANSPVPLPYTAK